MSHAMWCAALCLATGVASAQEPPLLSIEFGADELVRIDAGTGTVTPVGPLGVDVAIGLTMTRFDGQLYLMDAGFGPLPPSLYTLDEATGAASLVAALSLPGSTIDFAEALTADAAGLLAVIDDEPGNSSRSKQMCRLDASTGVLVPLGRLSVGLPGDDGDLDAVVFDPSTGDLIGVDGAPLESLNYYRRADTQSGAVTELDTFTTADIDGLVNGLHLEGSRLFAVTSGVGASLGSIAEVEITPTGVTLVGVTPLVASGGSYNGLARASQADCPADVNGDGLVNPADFNAWVIAFNTQAPECDQNGDGLCTPADFNVWVINFNAGC
ncbi:MAG: GC-type dockerin domain-anchored protein [Planctomycetota bacterium]